MDVNNYSHDQEPRRRETISAVARYIDSDIDWFCYFPTSLSFSLSLSISLGVVLRVNKFPSSGWILDVRISKW